MQLLDIQMYLCCKVTFIICQQVYTKMFLANTQSQAGQQVLIASPAEGQGQTIKFLSNNLPNSNMGSPTKTITFAQAQQMGLLPSNKVQHILPTSTQKQTVSIGHTV